MTRRFSSQELYFLRNKVPIDRVIVSFLFMPSHYNEDKLRFACPLCQNFNTSIHTKTNLARCFTCQQNFNTIEIVMHHFKIGFVESVKWIKKRNADLVNENEVINYEDHVPQPHMGSALFEMQSSQHSDKSFVTSSDVISERITILEKRIEQLFLLIKELRAFSSR